MKKHKSKIIAAVVIIAVLAAAWVFGGDYANKNAAPDNPTPPVVTPQPPDDANVTPTPTPKETPDAPPTPAAPTAAPDVTPPAPDTPTPTPSATPEVTPTPDTPPPTSTPEPTPTSTPAPAPPPVEPGDVTVGETVLQITLSVRCDTILANLGKLSADKHELVPSDGVIFPKTTVTFNEGESVFNVLQREMKRAKIHFEFMNTPIYNSAYIEGIGNIYEFDVGELSGWMYRVNGTFPGYGCSRYQLKDGDNVEWIYTCDLGADIGGTGAIGGAGEAVE